MIATGPEADAASEAWPARPYRVRPAGADELSGPLGPNVLLAFRYGDFHADPPDEARRVTIGLPLLHGSRAGEIWESRLPVTAGVEAGVSYAENGEVLMLRLSVSAAAFADIEGASARAYAELLRVTAGRGYPHLLRIWNFIGDINLGDGDAERYRRFCVGRHEMLSRFPQFEGALPAATAIGTAGGGLTVIALAGRRPGRQVENPQQVSAYRYPRVYGARSPSFSRATLVPWADGPQLLVSGTASIVGHATTNTGDPQAQLKQTMANIQTLVSQPGLARRGFLPEMFTLYLRHPHDLLPLRPLIDRYFADTPLQVLHGDICRRELLLEVEAIYRLPRILSK